MNCNMERLSTKLERLKPSCSGYNRIQPVLLSRSVTQMLNNPLPVDNQMGRQKISRQLVVDTKKAEKDQNFERCKGVLSITDVEWEEVYPTVKYKRNSIGYESEANEGAKKFTFYRSCSTRLT